MEAIVKTRPSLFRVALGAFFLLASYGILMGALPAELAARKVGPSYIGLVVGSYAFGAVCFRLFALNVVDLAGAQKTAAIASAVGVFSSLSLGLTMVVFDAALPMLAAANFINGVASSAFMTAGYTYVAQAGAAEKRGTRIGVYGSIGSLGLLLVPPIGIWIWSLGPGAHLWLLPFALMFPVVALLPGDQQSVGRGSENEDKSRSLESIMRYGVFPSLLALAVSAMMQGGFEAHMPLLVIEFDASAIIVQLYALFGLSVAGGRSAGGWLVDKLGEKPVFFGGLACQILGLFLPLNVPTATGLLSSAVLFGLGSGLVGTSAIALLVAAVPPQRAGAAIGLGGLLRDTGVAAGAAATGVLLAIGGATTFLLAGCVATSVAAGAAALLFRASDNRLPTR
jgi:MFS family permease